ncbi:protein GAST1-like isoform X1 [Cryptomeria japonica]|uniref:protein GAST1-like isoform X1 n=1 Tax=Cryptomeria japonica TaxID=3369 RepID=UPI0027DAA55F|nr:protein GAST1-like isoform X1 [Cryptomeria japonica]
MARLHQYVLLFIAAVFVLQHIMVFSAPTPRVLYHWQHGEQSRNVGNNGTTPQNSSYGAMSPSPGLASGTLTPSGCMPACSNRCSATHHVNACMYFCQYCCAKCLCVPPGTYGNKESCPCYNNMKTKEGGPKCP